MKCKVRREWLTRWDSLLGTGGLFHLRDMLLGNSGLLIKGAFEDDEGGKCLATWAGHYLGISGPEFLCKLGLPEVSEVVYAWDTDRDFPRQLLRAIQQELFYRGVTDGRDSGPDREQPTRPRHVLRQRTAVGG